MFLFHFGKKFKETDTISLHTKFDQQSINIKLFINETKNYDDSIGDFCKHVISTFRSVYSNAVHFILLYWHLYRYILYDFPTLVGLILIIVVSNAIFIRLWMLKKNIGLFKGSWDFCPLRSWNLP